MQSKAKSRDKSRVIRENQIDLPGFSVFELFDELALYYERQMLKKYPSEPSDYKSRCPQALILEPFNENSPE